MAKKKKDASSAAPAPSAVDMQSPLGRAFAAYVAGDMVAARTLATSVIESGGLSEDTKLVEKLAAELDVSSPMAVHVAADLVARSAPPAKTFVFAAASLCILTLLVLLALTRY